MPHSEFSYKSLSLIFVSKVSGQARPTKSKNRFGEFASSRVGIGDEARETRRRSHAKSESKSGCYPRLRSLFFLYFESLQTFGLTAGTNLVRPHLTDAVTIPGRVWQKRRFIGRRFAIISFMGFVIARSFTTATLTLGRAFLSAVLIEAISVAVAR